MTSLPCIVCGTTLFDAMPGNDVNQPSGGVEFTSPGHYGSTVHDPMDGSLLVINLCDECLLRRGSRYILHRTSQPRRPRINTDRPWRG